MKSYFTAARTDATRCQVVHLGHPLVAGLRAAIADLPEGGFRRAAELVARCREALIAAGFEGRTEGGDGTLISFRVPGDAADVVKAAYERGAVIRHLPDGWPRASAGWRQDSGGLER